MNSKIVWPVLLLSALRSGLVFAESAVEFHRTLPIPLTDHIILDVAVPTGDVTISYIRAGEISVSAAARGAEDKIPADFFERGLVVKRDGEHVKVQFNADHAAADIRARITYTIYVPNWIAINSNVGSGKQTISGVMGPVKAVSGTGDLVVSYITSTLDAKTGRGDISVIRVGDSARVETGSGNINMKDIGPGPGTRATVVKGIGRVDVDGFTGSFVGSTDAGELRVAGGVFDNWDLKSASGDIHIHTGQDAKFDIDAETRSGRLSVENTDIELPENANARACHQKVNGGGKLVRARSVSGTIFIQ